MAGASSDGGDANYWPGFVDALTNVVIAMVFVIVVLAMALSFSAQLLAKRMAEKVAELQASNAALIAQNSTPGASAPLAPSAASPAPAPAATQRAESNMAKPNMAIAAKGDEAAASAPGGQLRQAAATLVIDFTGSALRLDDDAQRRLVEGLVQVKEQLAAAPAGAKLLLLARGPQQTLTENQRTAFLRIMLVRNTLIEQGFAPERIATRIDTNPSPGRPSVSIVLEKAP